MSGEALNGEATTIMAGRRRGEPSPGTVPSSTLENLTSKTRIVVLLGQHRPDKADQGVAVGEMPTTSVRRRISRFSRSVGLLDQMCFQISFGNTVNARIGQRAGEGAGANAAAGCSAPSYVGVASMMVCTGVGTVLRTRHPDRVRRSEYSA